MGISDGLSQPGLRIRQTDSPFARHTCGIGSNPEIDGGLQPVEQRRTNELMRLENAQRLQQLCLRTILG